MARPRLKLPPQTPTDDWKQRLYRFIGALRPEDGPMGAAILPTADNPAQNYRRYYFAVVAGTFSDWLRNTGQPLPEGVESFDDYAHMFLKKKCLSYPVMGPDGELTHVVGSIANGKISDERFDLYVYDARKYLWDEYKLFTADPDKNWRTAKREAVTA